MYYVCICLYVYYLYNFIMSICMYVCMCTMFVYVCICTMSIYVLCIGYSPGWRQLWAYNTCKIIGRGQKKHATM